MIIEKQETKNKYLDGGEGRDFFIGFSNALELAALFWGLVIVAAVTIIVLVN